jgi:hypothetical protein
MCTTLPRIVQYILYFTVQERTVVRLTTYVLTVGSLPAGVKPFPRGLCTYQPELHMHLNYLQDMLLVYIHPTYIHTSGNQDLPPGLLGWAKILRTVQYVLYLPLVVLGDTGLRRCREPECSSSA